MAGGRDLRLRFFGPSGPGPHGRFRPSSGWPLYEQEDDEGMCWNRARPPSPPNPHGIPLRAVKVRGLACLCVGEMPAHGDSAANACCRRRRGGPDGRARTPRPVLVRSGAAPEFPNHGAATCAWHDGRVVTGTRGPARASIYPPLTPTPQRGSSSPLRLSARTLRPGSLSLRGSSPSDGNSTSSLPGGRRSSPRPGHDRETRRRGNVESHPSASTRQLQT